MIFILVMSRGILTRSRTIVSRSVHHGSWSGHGEELLKFITKPIIWMFCPTLCLLRALPLISVVLAWHGVRADALRYPHQAHTEHLHHSFVMSPPLIGAYSCNLLLGRTGFVTTKALEWFGWYSRPSTANGEIV
jgi:ABC-type Fe3+ transport system permease subunit